MTTSIRGHSADQAPLAPPTPEPLGDPDAGLATLTPHSVTRRVLERFALIAFGLYHLPLALNNYPSLGGGGFNDNGLAVRWGHVFTPVGVWVARHLFGMTGPMPSAYSGDNGDVGEEFGRLLVSVVIAVVGAVWWTAADRNRPRGRWVEGTLRVLLRYSIALGLAGYALAKILPIQFPPLTATVLESRLGDMTPMGLLWSFMQYSRTYSFFGGVMELAVVVLLCFRRTATLGALMCLAVMTNVTLLNYAYGVQVKLYSTMIVASAAVLVLYDVPRLLAVFVTNRAAAPAPLSSLLQDRLPALARWTIKVVLVGSVIVSCLIAMISTTSARRRPSSLDGAWLVTSFTRNGVNLDSTGNAARWRRIAVDGFGVAIWFESDSLARCRPSPSADPATIGFTCARNRQGELRWTRTGNVLALEGVFDGAPVTASARFVDPSETRLLRSKFRWIYDR